MNEEEFEPSGNDGRIAIQPGVGTLIFARPLARDEAIYQCVATNIAGTALSVKIDLRRGGMLNCTCKRICVVCFSFFCSVE